MECNIYQSVKSLGVPKKKIREVVSLVYKSCKKDNPIVSIHFIGDKKMRSINKKYRNKDSSTDVLSFAIKEGEYSLDSNEWGDIFISIPYIKAQAKRVKVVYKEELFRMLIHGTLHLVGHDHTKPKEAKKMFTLQEAILKKVI